MGTNAGAMPNFYDLAAQNAQALKPPTAQAAPAAGVSNPAQNPFQTPLWQTPQSQSPGLPGLPTGQVSPDADLGKTSDSLSGQVNSNLSSPMDWSSFMPGGDRVQDGQYYNDAATNATRDKFNLWNNDQFATDEEKLRTQLLNRGVNPGDQGYDQQLQLLRDEQGKLRQSSNLDAILTGGAEGARMQGMDINAGNYNTGQRQDQINEAITRREQPLNEKVALDNSRAPDQNTNASKVGSILQGIPGVLDAFKTGADGTSLAGSAINGVSGLVNKLTGGKTAGVGTALAGKAAGALGLGASGAVDTGAIAAAQAGALGELGAGTTAATAATGAAAGGSGMMAGITAAAPWVAAAIGVGLVAANQMKEASPLNDSFDAASGTFTKGAHFDNTKWSADELNQFLGPALKVFSQTGDAQQALSAIPQPTNDREKKLLKGGAKSLFGGTGNPFRVIAKQNGFGEGIWTAGNKDKKAAIKSVGG